MHAGENDRVLSDPHIVFDDGVALQRQVGPFGRRHVPPLQRVKGKGGDGIHLVVRAVHDELNACRDLTEFPDDEPVAVPFIQVGNVAFKVRVGDIGEIPDRDIGICDRRFYIDLFVVPRDWVYGIRVGTFSVLHSAYLRIFRRIGLVAAFSLPTIINGNARQHKRFDQSGAPPVRFPDGRGILPLVLRRKRWYTIFP